MPIKSVITNRYFTVVQKKSILTESCPKMEWKNYELLVTRSFQAETEWLSVSKILQKEWLAGFGRISTHLEIKGILWILGNRGGHKKNLMRNIKKWGIVILLKACPARNHIPNLFGKIRLEWGHPSQVKYLAWNEPSQGRGVEPGLSWEAGISYVRAEAQVPGGSIFPT